MQRLPITLSDEEHTYLKEESSRLGLPIAEIIRILINDYKIDIRDFSQREYKLELWRRIVKARDRYYCGHCNQKFSEKTTDAHHIKPVKKGGKNTLNNGITMCKLCHSLIHTKFRVMYKLD